MKHRIIIGSLITTLAAARWLSSAESPETAAPPPKPRPLIQMAILLDTSGSMSGLINQARTHLWKIVNELVLASRDGQRPDLRVALYEYGKSSIPASEGHLRQIVPLTDDLDKVSEELFALTTNGGSEYCGQVIQAAVSGLRWSESPNDLKVIFIAGNEPFTQGSVDPKIACREAIARGIIVNTVHCGYQGSGEEEGWKQGALLADGSFTQIDHNSVEPQIPAPQDQEILRLGEELNKTYVPFGKAGAEGQARQVAQDSNSSSVGSGSSVQRAVSKSSGFYRNALWDLVDAVKEAAVKLEELKKEDLPEEMRKMTVEEQKAFLETKAARRKEIQAKIQELSEARKKFVAAEMKKRSESAPQTLESALIENLRAQAEKKGFGFESKESPSTP
ncbi:MAG: VWA domain-containing protein [Planctomycetes bacterium]|nr:VWA domain-containing protein [Planctomycetota bacterium]